MLSQLSRRGPIDSIATYRSLRDGGWLVLGSLDKRIAVSKKDRNMAKLGDAKDSLIEYIEYLKSISKNVVLTQTPQKGGFEDDIIGLSRRLGVDYFIDHQPSYLTTDGIHLSPSSSKIWTANLVWFLKAKYLTFEGRGQ